MSGRDRRPYLSATVLDQALLDYCADNFETKIEIVVEIETPGGGMIYASDRNKYVGPNFYEALLTIPVISRTVGEWLSPTLQFSTVSLTLSNADGRFNQYLPGGVNYNSFIGNSIEVKIGLNEQAATYKTIFRGQVTEVGGFSRDIVAVSFIARDDYERLNQTFPKFALTRTSYPDLDDNTVGKILPVIYGDWTVSLDPDPAIVPTLVLNGADANVIGGSRTNIQLRISDNDLTFFDTNNVYFFKSDVYTLVPSADIVSVGAGNKTFQIRQNTSSWLDGAPYLYTAGDEFFVRVRGYDLSGFDNNPVEQARHLLITQGGAVSGDFDASWNSYRSKVTPTQSAISLIKSRIWENEPKPTMEYALSLLEQVRLESFINDELKLQINSLHFEDFNASPTFNARNYDIVASSLRPKIDDRNNFNRAQATFDYHPNRNEQAQTSPLLRNDAAVAQVGRQISKRVAFPNLYDPTQVKDQLREIVRMASSLFEIIDCSLTWRALLLDIGDFLMLNIEIGSVIYENVPAMIRSKGHDPEGIKIPVTLWSMQLLPFPSYTPGYSGTVGGYSATITEES